MKKKKKWRTMTNAQLLQELEQARKATELDAKALLELRRQVEGFGATVDKLRIQKRELEVHNHYLRKALRAMVELDAHRPHNFSDTVVGVTQVGPTWALTKEEEK